MRRVRVTVVTPSVITVCITPGMNGRPASININGVAKLL
jgi:hypothetical protein